jgi:hypothetical protein
MSHLRKANSIKPGKSGQGAGSGQAPAMTFTQRLAHYAAKSFPNELTGRQLRRLMKKDLHAFVNAEK